ncbi:MAG: DUF86 domain-containing protein [Blautia sp.]|nr:DUF86 domain-containing protein [Lachnoclostridium sp.]MCM1211872.1 DUF86 domain-containing protein [Blautia sp.]
MRNDVIIGKMQGYIEKILRYTQNLDYDTFVKQEVVMEACVFNLSQLGELAGKIDSEYRGCHKEIPWSQIYGLRNRIVHDYEGVNFMLVWEIICNDLPELQEMLKNIK